MYIGVLLHVGLLMESLAAILAGIRSGIAVDEQMRGEGRGALERLAALFALQGRKKEKNTNLEHVKYLFPTSHNSSQIYHKLRERKKERQ